MNTMEYKGFPARVEYSEEDGCFVGLSQAFVMWLAFTVKALPSCVQPLKKL
jgi:predicted HicB family RNase H-like nuclease